MSGNRKSNILKKASPAKSESTQRYLPGSIQHCLAVLEHSIGQEVGSLLARAHDHEHQIQKAYASVTLVGREKAAELLAMSPAQLDRYVAVKKLEAVYLDRRPRFRVSELNRFIEANGKRFRGRRSRS